MAHKAKFPFTPEGFKAARKDQAKKGAKPEMEDKPKAKPKKKGK